VSTELISQCLYHGNDRSFLVQNTLFRCGGAAVLLSNKIRDGYKANFKLLTSVRTQLVSEDSMEAVFQKEDDERHVGVQLSKEIPKVAGRALEKNFTALGTRVLPLSEQAKVVFWMFARWISKTLKFEKKIDPYIPDFTRGLDHFCVHAGGRAVIDSVEKNLKLTKAHVEASRYALYNYGNTSSSSIWYEMDYIRSHSSLKVGQRVLQIAFGSGFKCNSAVWLCINNNIKKQKEPKDFVFADSKKEN
jgi:3-ketoacyl-CoA synthase